MMPYSSAYHSWNPQNVLQKCVVPRKPLAGVILETGPMLKLIQGLGEMSWGQGSHYVGSSLTPSSSENHPYCSWDTGAFRGLCSHPGIVPFLREMIGAMLLKQSIFYAISCALQSKPQLYSLLYCGCTSSKGLLNTCWMNEWVYFCLVHF